MANEMPPITNGRYNEGSQKINPSSQPTSPTKSAKSGKHGDQHFDDDDLASLDGSQLTNDYSSQFSINMGATTAGAENLVPHAPDGGYGWVIVLAAFMSNFVVDGISTAFSEFKKSYKDHFGESDALTSLIGSLIIGCYLLVGPIVGGLCNKYEPRYIVIIGALISGTAFVCAVSAPNIYVFMIIYGGIGGIGFGMIYLPAIVVVGFYFESKRAMATGVAVAGSGVGTFVVPIVSQYCITTLGWDKTLWVLAAFCYSCVFYGILYRPLPLIDANELREQEMQPVRQALSKLSGEDHDEDISSNAIESPQVNRCQSGASGTLEKDDDPSHDPTLQRMRNELTEENNEKVRSNTHHTIRSRKHTLTSMGSEMTSQHDLKSSRGNLAENRLSKVSARSYAQSLSKLSKGGGASSLSIAMSGIDPHEFTRPLNRQDIFYGGSIKNLAEFKQEGNMTNFRSSTLSIPRSIVGQAVSNMNLSRAGSRLGGSQIGQGVGVADDEEEIIEEFIDDGKCKCLPLPIRNAFAEMIDLELLKDPIMMLLCVSNLLGMMGFYIPFMFLKDLSESMKLDATWSGYLVPIIGITNTVGRVFFGWVADKKYMSALNINNISLLVCGVLTLICPLLRTLTGQLFYSFFFGFIISAYICLTSIVLADLMGLEKLTNSFGLLVVARGVASLAGSPFAGLVYDLTKSYDAAFYFGGFVILIAGLISCAIPFVLKKQKRRMAEEDLEEEKRKQKQNGVVEEVSEEEIDETVPLKNVKQND